ncbi:MAG: sigma-70 family RNA polymerase sigma factor [Gemmataceae bacterium]|nr:sigma-70 family RNA polymerase sigma factor [Gemmataceae bacterium]
MNADDRRCISEVLNGRTEAFGFLVKKYQDRLYNAILRVVDNREDALDVVQESFIHAYQSLNSFKGDAEFFTWLYRIAFNAAISQKRKRKVQLSLDLPANENGRSQEPEDQSTLNQPSDRIEQEESDQRIHLALSRLAPEHRAVLILKDLEGHRYEEIAEILDIPIGTVRSRIHRARVELREIIEALENKQ